MIDNNTDDPSQLWAEIHRLRAQLAGPGEYATWQEAAVAERLRRIKAEQARESAVLRAVSDVNPCSGCHDSAAQQVGSLRFDVELAPLTKVVIDDERETLRELMANYAQHRKWVKVASFLAATYLLVLVVAMSVSWVSLDEATWNNSLYISIAAGIALVVVGMEIHPRINAVMAAAQQALADLDLVTQNPIACEEIVEWATLDPVLRRYQHHLAEQGRLPVMAEYEAMRAWMGACAAKAFDDAWVERREAACQVLAKPI